MKSWARVRRRAEGRGRHRPRGAWGGSGLRGAVLLRRPAVPNHRNIYQKGESEQHCEDGRSGQQ